MTQKDDYVEAKRMATEAHKKQKYGKNPYTFHLAAVEQALRRFGYDPDGEGDEDHIALSWDLVTAAWLHDIVEDTPVEQSEISKKFGHRVASLVHAVTNPSGGNRAWRASKVYPKIKYTPHALTLKLADRVANVEHSKASGSGLINMYRKEWKGFKEKYYVEDDGHQEMWDAIERALK